MSITVAKLALLVSVLLFGVCRCTTSLPTRNVSDLNGDPSLGETPSTDGGGFLAPDFPLVGPPDGGGSPLGSDTGTGHDLAPADLVALMPDLGPDLPSACADYPGFGGPCDLPSLLDAGCADHIGLLVCVLPPLSDSPQASCVCP